MKETTDVWFIAFLLHKGYEIKKYKVLQHRKVKCQFDIEPDLWRQLKLEFNNSDIIKFKMLIDQIKDLAY